MRVRQISVDKLFGIFDHRIPLNMEERITILHGLNGYGKTIVLRLLDGLLNGSYAPLRSVPFDRFVVEFDDGSSLSVKKSGGETAEGKKKWKSSSGIQFTYARPNGEEELFPVTGVEQHVSKLLEAEIEYLLKRRSQALVIQRLGPDTWSELHTGERLSFEDVLERYGNLLPSEVRETLLRSEPEWLKAIHKSVHARLIRTQRLDAQAAQLDFPQVPAVKKYSDEIADELQSALTRYAAKSQELDRTFPIRLLQGHSSGSLTADEVKRRLEDLEKRRLRLADLGFIDPKEHQDLGQQRVGESQLAVLGLYVNDVEEKLNVFDALAAKIELFTEIINHRFQYKKLAIRREKGFVFITAAGTELPPSALSSGEQHELVLLYEMLFKVEPNSLILLDEPEISLHIAWQNEFLKDLQQIVSLAGFDVLLATHSPDIIGERWDLTVKLEGPKDGAAKVA